jgi:hypothetical protein
MIEALAIYFFHWLMRDSHLAADEAACRHSYAIFITAAYY